MEDAMSKGGLELGFTMCPKCSLHGTLVVEPGFPLEIDHKVWALQVINGNVKFGGLSIDVAEDLAIRVLESSLRMLPDSQGALLGILADYNILTHQGKSPGLVWLHWKINQTLSAKLN
jgi:hypothetical protein